MVSTAPRVGAWLAAALLFLTAGAAEAARKPAAAPPPAPRIEKLGRLLALEDERSAGGGELERLLRDPDRGVRRRAALAAGRIGDPALVSTLVDLLNDPETEVRQMSAFALGLVGQPAAVDPLVAALGDPESVVRARAVEALGRIGEARAAGEIARFVLASLPKAQGRITVREDEAGQARDPWNEARLGLFALARLKNVPAAEAVLLANGKPRFDWWAATWTAMRLESPSLRPVLMAAAASEDPRSRALAARGLGALKEAATFDALAPLVHDADEGVAVEALRALAPIGEARGTALAAQMLASSSDVVRHEALQALSVLPPDPTLRGRLVPLVGDRNPWMRAAALGALARTDPEDFALVLSGTDPDPVWWVRAALAQALGAMGDATGVEILHAMLKDADPRVLPSVLEALRHARGDQSLDTLRRHLDHPDLGVRAAAAEGIAALAGPGASADLLAAWKRDLADGPGELEARLAAVAGLAAQKDGAAKTALLEVARADPARAVRARAATALRAAGVADVPDPGPEVVHRPPLDYRAAMAPYDPQPAVALYTPRAFLHTRRGTIEIHLDVVETPLTTASFVELARRGFYDGLTFHRLEPGFVVQGGDPRGDGNGGPGYTLRCENAQRPYGRGSVGMALSGKDTGGSQFFITYAAQPHLDGRYTLFGSVVGGMDVVDRVRPGDVIERVEVWTGE